MAYSLEIFYTLPELIYSEVLGIEPGLDTFLMLVGVAGCAGQHW